MCGSLLYLRDNNQNQCCPVEITAKYADRKDERTSDLERQELRRQRFKELEWQVIQRLKESYQKMTSEENREDISD
jgi:hypothetical protein